MTLYCYRVTTKAGTFDVMAATPAKAINQAWYLANTRRPPVVISCLQMGEW
jgi:hypothetical protein